MLCYITYTHQYTLLLAERPSPYNESLHAGRSWTRDFLFSISIIPIGLWGPPSLLYDGHPCSFPGIKRPGRGVGHPSTPRAKVDEYSKISPPPLYFLAGDVCLRLNRAVHILKTFFKNLLIRILYTYIIKQFRISESRYSRYFLRNLVATSPHPPPPPIFKVLYHYNAEPSDRAV